MSEIEADRDVSDTGIFDTEIFVAAPSDEALEGAASLSPTDPRAYTIAMCTGLAECPF